MDRKGRKLLRAHEFRVLQHAASRTRPGAVSPPPGECGEAAPPTLLGGLNGKNIGKMDTGERKASIGVDWLQGTIPFERMDMLFDYLSEMCGTQPEIYNHGFMGYQCSAEWHPYGIKVLWDTDRTARDFHANRICIQLTGQSLAGFPPSSLMKFMYDMSVMFWLKCSRIDLSFDDFEKIVRPAEVTEYANQGSYKGFRKHRPVQEQRRNGELLGEGVYFGTRGKDGGGKYLRCYAKDIESEGKTDSIRWEVEFSKAKANRVFFDLAMATDLTDFASMIALFIGGAIDFVERGNSGKCNKLDRLAFWEQILHHLGAATVRCPEPDGSIDKTIVWFERSVYPSMEKVRKAVGDDALYQQLLDGMQHAVLSKLQLNQIRVYRNMHGDPSETCFS
jgi:hypothetical protein